MTNHISAETSAAQFNGKLMSQLLYVQCAGRDSDQWRTCSLEKETDAQAEVERLQQQFPSLRFRIVTIDQIDNKTSATWSMSLDVECPFCNEFFDLLAGDWPEDIAPGEHGTPATTNYDVECPGCDRELLVDFEY